MSKIENKFEEMDKLLLELEEEFVAFQKGNKKLKQFFKKVKTLETFYHSEDWLNHRESLSKPFHSASEDAIWNLSQDVYKEKIKLLKFLTKSI